ncbi:hypothetical protein [Microbacterium proteolyticum]|uniref:hypothetical protein n=1 Tax=Microbacterium proteolyticum TaxID=1572644 RepID=UPI001FAD9732|nr:hypothetical protein [Microbacterium proteolyticum]MCI9859038.1 hypothetical protein [Microbacterium proteolyticum]
MSSTMPVSETQFEYRGKRYSRHSGGDDYVRLVTDNAPTREAFPDAIEMNDDPQDPWVKLPRRVISARFAQEVTGTWHGVPVTVGERIRTGLRRGMVRVWYAGTTPDEALAAGLDGNQNDGWSALAQPSDVGDVHVESTRHPMVSP